MPWKHAMKTRFLGLFAYACLGVLAPAIATPEFRAIGWSKSEYAAIESVRVHADPLLESKLKSCFGPRDQAKTDAVSAGASAGFSALKREIDDRLAMDQDARLMYQMAGYDRGSYAAMVARQVDADNLPFVREVHEKYGLPGSKEVGLDAALNFLTLAIHADKNRKLQMSILHSIDGLPSSDPDKAAFLGPAVILRSRESYKPRNDEAIPVPYEKPNEPAVVSGGECAKNASTRWYPWHVQESLDKGLLEKARAHAGSMEKP